MSSMSSLAVLLLPQKLDVNVTFFLFYSYKKDEREGNKGIYQVHNSLTEERMG